MPFIIAIFSIIIFLVIIFFTAEFFLSKKHGDAAVRLELSEITHKFYEEKNNSLTLTFDLPFINPGRQHGLIIDCNARLQPQGDTFRFVKSHCRVINVDNVRFDDYWDGLVLKPNKNGRLRIVLTMESGDVASIKKKLDKFRIDIFFRYYGRGLMKFERTQIPFNFSDFVSSSSSLELTDMFPIPEKAVKREVPADIVKMSTPVRTHILMPGEKMTDIIEQYITSPSVDDIFTIAESALAIMQKRVYYVDDIKPSALAVKLSNFFEMDSSLSSPYSMQKAMDEVGAWRIVLAVFAGMMGKIIGRKGDFYRVAGKPAAVIDDCTGTLPPFDKYIVMGPSDMNKDLAEVKEATGMDAAVVDANDLHKVDVLAATDRKDIPIIEKALEWNPAGNANEQTPIVIIHRKNIV